MLGVELELDPEGAAVDGKLGAGMGVPGVLSLACAGGFENCEADIPPLFDTGVVLVVVGLAGAIGTPVGFAPE